MEARQAIAREAEQLLHALVRAPCEQAEAEAPAALKRQWLEEQE